MTLPIDLLLRTQAEEDERVEELAHTPPGRIMRSMALVPPPRMLWRFAGHGGGDDRDRNGVARGADAAVARAEASSGRPLPADVRARFEQALSADLSSVRIHTGDESAAAAHAVGAHAYTVGNDIHFADDAYRPGDPFGLHLLAHEVAHTVQQAGGQAQRQHKLEVSTPGDAAEIEADRAADAMVAGQAATVSGAPVMAARDDKDPPAAAAGSGGSSLSDLLEVTNFNFTKPGAVSAKPAGDGVDIESPPIDLTADVAVKKSAPPDEVSKLADIKVGSIQNVMSSDRVGVYTKPDGTVAVEYKCTAPNAADAQTDPNNPSQRNKQSEPPFYQKPDTLDSNKPFATALMHDQPGFQIPTTMSGGTLTETRGSDNFITAVGAKRKDEVVQLQQEQWSVPWALKIDSSKTGAGNDVDAKGTKDQAPITDNSPITAAQAKEWFSFKTVEDAKAAPPATLLRSLPVARTQDPDSYKNIVQAVTELNWRLTLTVTCTNTYSLVGKDHVTVTARGSGSFTHDLDVNTNESGDVTFNFGTVFDPASWQDGSKISITVVAEGHTFSSTWAAPFDSAPAAVLPDSEKRYTLAKSRA